MPELPEVETVRRGLEPLLQGREIIAVTCHRHSLRYALPDLTSLVGKRLKHVQRRSKYLLFSFDPTQNTAADMKPAQILIWHLGMTGQFHVLPQQAKAGAHEHVCFHFDDGQSLRYRDARRFGYAGLLDADAWQSHAWFARLGPEPLSTAFDINHLAEICMARKAPIKNIIMDAKNVVGVGNIYAAESLFRAGIHPARAAGRISRARLALLLEMIQQVLQEAIAAGGSSIRDFVNSDGKPGYFAHSFQVYGRQGKACLRCQKHIKRITQAGRSSFYCPGCQH